MKRGKRRLAVAEERLVLAEVVEGEVGQAEARVLGMAAGKGLEALRVLRLTPSGVRVAARVEVYRGPEGLRSRISMPGLPTAMSNALGRAAAGPLPLGPDAEPLHPEVLPGEVRLGEVEIVPGTDSAPPRTDGADAYARFVRVPRPEDYLDVARALHSVPSYGPRTAKVEVLESPGGRRTRITLSGLPAPLASAVGRLAANLQKNAESIHVHEPGWGWFCLACALGGPNGPVARKA